jgi:hypothetical protein
VTEYLLAPVLGVQENCGRAVVTAVPTGAVGDNAGAASPAPGKGSV